MGTELRKKNHVKLPSILIVDDDAGQRSLLDSFLRTQGFETVMADSGERALEILQSQKPDMIISDVRMPGMTGLEMLPKVRELRPTVPVIMITAYGDPETRRKAIEGGATGLLTKPIDFTLLREEIDTRLAQAN